MSVAIGTMNVQMNVLLLSEEIFLVCKAEMEIRNCYLLVALGIPQIQRKIRQNPCFKAILNLSPLESLLGHRHLY